MLLRLTHLLYSTSPMTLPPAALGKNLYAALGLPTPTSAHPISSSHIRAAYRTALLKHHPDKAPARAETDDAALYKDYNILDRSVDTITLARTVLLSPHLRSQYDQTLITSRGKTLGLGDTAPGQTESLDTIDLDDMQYDEKEQRWFQPCRCGNVEAFELREEDLETALLDYPSRNEVLVSCGGCSLYVKVAFEKAE